MEKRRDPINGGFNVFVIPKEDTITDALTVPMTVLPSHSNGLLRVVGEADHTGVHCASWAFTNQTRKSVVKHLRGLADWIEKNAIEDSKHPKTAECDHPWHNNPALLIPCPACGAGREPDEDGPCGHCDTCGDRCDEHGCMKDRSHVIAKSDSHST